MSINKNNHYKNFPLLYKIELLNRDITEYVDKDSLSNISSSLDIISIGDVRRNRCTFVITEDTGLFNPQKTTNFFTENMFNHKGIGAKVVIKAGFLLDDGTEDLSIIFTGELREIKNTGKRFRYSLLISDPSTDIRRREIEDFGIEKGILLQPKDSSSTGRYPFPSIVSPPSKESFSNPRSQLGTTLNEVDVLKTEGFLNKNNFKVNNNILETEGGEREDNDNPIIDFKAPHKWIGLKRAITEITDHYDVDRGTIEISQPIIDNHITLIGQPAYFLENDTYGESSSAIWRYNGFITNLVATPTKVYMCYSSSLTISKGQIIEYDIATDTFSSIYQHSSHAEFWGLALSGNNIIILGCTNTNYDARLPNSDIRIWSYSIDRDTISVLADKNDTLKPQLGLYYHFGDNTQIEGTVPDSRKNIKIYDNRIYYLGYNNTSNNACIASVSVSGGAKQNEIEIDRNELNYLGVSYTISGTGSLIAVADFVTSNGSTQQIVSKDLS